MDKRLSEDIDFIKVPLTIFVVLLHSYTTITINNNLYYSLSYPVLTIGEIGVPAFLFISGYLYFTKMSSHWDWQQYKKKNNKRRSTLLRPYIVWNSIMILFYFILGMFPSLNGYFSGANKPISEYEFYDFILAYWNKGEAINGTPILQPYWYIRNLIVLCLLSPAIYFLTKRFGILLLSITCMWWLFTNHNAFTQISIFFFCLGAFCQINNLKFYPTERGKNKNVVYTIAISLFLIDFVTHVYFPINGILQIHRVNLIFSIVALFTITNTLATKYKLPDIFKRSAFFVYTIHFPIILTIRKFLYKLCDTPNGIIQFTILIFAFITTYALCLAIYKAWKDIYPQSLDFIMGGRI